ncbi:MAG: hypothetical protein OEZ09_00460 [Betaproteobacteria bacterium]|nr:hypothetical protein [Betaproteobacteria bacterium]MDH5576906.1 hypothetical protein [Betaproteobacteria bacterium]
MNAFEIEQIEKDVRANFRLPLSFEGWAEVERQARQERARVLAGGVARLFSSLWARLSRFGRGVRNTAADCTSARLHHS